MMLTTADQLLQLLQLRQQKIVLLQQLLQDATMMMTMTVDQLLQQQRLLVQPQLQVLPQVDQPQPQQQQRLQARLEGPNSLTNLVFFSYQKNKFCLVHKLKVRISSSIKLDQQECRI
jgi:hypothetical protein